MHNNNKINKQSKMGIRFNTLTVGDTKDTTVLSMRLQREQEMREFTRQ
jgi:hypothetical protein